MKKLLLTHMMLLSISMSSQVYTKQYTHYAQLDTVSQKMLLDIAYSTTVTVSYNANKIVIEDDFARFVLNIDSNSGTEDNLIFECKSESDSVYFNVIMLVNKEEYQCIVSKNNFKRIYKKKL